MTAKRPVVMHVIHALSSGGLENGLVNIINRMSSADYTHHIVCLTIADDFSSRIKNPSVTIHQLHKREGHDFRMYWRFFRLLGRLRPDIIHTRNFGTLEMQILGLRFRGIGRVHGEHGRDMFDLHGEHRAYNRFRKFMSRFVDRYVAVSKDLQRWLVDVVQIDSKRIVQIYNGVDQDKFSPLLTKGREGFPESLRMQDVLIVGSVGRLAEVKSQETLIHAFARVLEKHKELRAQLGLVLVGDGPMRSYLADLVESYTMSDRCWFAGDRSDVNDLLPEMDIFVLPSLNEGISNTILEAMACGLPVIATKVGGNPELVDDDVTGYLVPAEDSSSLADRIQELLFDKLQREKMGLAGRKKVEEHFNWDAAVRAYSNVYESLLAKSK